MCDGERGIESREAGKETRGIAEKTGVRGLGGKSIVVFVKPIRTIPVMNRYATSRGTAGFTLIEILTVIVIVGILSGVVGVSLSRWVVKARVDAARLQIRTFQTALKTYRMEQGRIPTEAQGLEALCAKPTVAPIPVEYPDEGYLESKRVPPDAWGNPFIYLVPGRDGEPYEIISYGSDGMPGGRKDAADLTSAEL